MSGQDPNAFLDAFGAVKALPDLTEQRFNTPGGGKRGRPFAVLAANDDELTVRTSTGGRVTLRSEPFQTAVKLVGDLGPLDPDGWVRVSDETLVAVLASENREKACTSYVLPLLEAAGLLELDRGRPARVRVPAGGEERS